MKNPDKKEIRAILKRKRLVYLWEDVSVAGTEAHTVWAIDIDVNYPWAGHFGSKADASAFSPAFVKAMKQNFKAWKQGFAYNVETAPKDHEGPIHYLREELKRVS